MHIGEYIIKRRKELNMTQKDLADKLLVTDKTISRWERGVSLPDLEMFKKLSIVLDLDINEYFSGLNVEINNDEKVDNDVIKKYRISYVVTSILFLFSSIIFILLRYLPYSNEDISVNIIFSSLFILSIIILMAGIIYFVVNLIKFINIFKVKTLKHIYKKELIISILVLLLVSILVLTTILI